MTRHHDDNPKRSHREIVAYLKEAGPVRVGDFEYDGLYLSSIVAVNPANLHHEATITPQLMAELGRMVAAARHAMNRAELDYRIWRDSTIFMLTNDLRQAVAAGFDCAVNPGVDSKGKPKNAKCPSVSVAEQYLRTQPEYRACWARQHAAEEAWSTLHAALDAAKQRTWAVKVQGGMDGPGVPRGDGHRTSAEPSAETYTPTPVATASDNPPPPPPPPPPAPHLGDAPPVPGMTPVTAGPPGPPPPPPNMKRS